jgi:hypothetical protein
VSAGENVFLNPIAAVAIAVIAVIRNRDRLHRQQAVGCKKVVAFFKKCGEVTMTNGLNHFNRDDAIIAAGQVPVVTQLNVDQVRESCFINTLTRQCELLFGNSHRRDATADTRCCLNSEAAPPSAYFK